MDSSHVRLKFDIKLNGQKLEQIRKNITHIRLREERERHGERVREGDREEERGERGSRVEGGEGGRGRERRERERERRETSGGEVWE